MDGKGIIREKKMMMMKKKKGRREEEQDFNISNPGRTPKQYIRPFCTGYNTSSPKRARSHQLHSIIPTNYRHHFMLSSCRRRGPVIYLVLDSRGSVRLYILRNFMFERVINGNYRLSPA